MTATERLHPDTVAGLARVAAAAPWLPAGTHVSTSHPGRRVVVQLFRVPTAEVHEVAALLGLPTPKLDGAHYETEDDQVRLVKVLPVSEIVERALAERREQASA